MKPGQVSCLGFFLAERRARMDAMLRSLLLRSWQNRARRERNGARRSCGSPCSAAYNRQGYSRGPGMDGKPDGWHSACHAAPAVPYKAHMAANRAEAVWNIVMTMGSACCRNRFRDMTPPAESRAQPSAGSSPGPRPDILPQPHRRYRPPQCAMTAKAAGME